MSDKAMHGSGAIIISIITLAVAWLLDFYIFQSVKNIVVDWDRAWAKSLVHWGFWIIGIGLPLSVIIGFMIMQSPPKSGTTAGMIMNLFITVFVTKLVFLLVVLGEDIYRLGAYLVSKISSMVNEGVEAQMPSRRKFIGQVGLIAAAVPFTSFLYGITKGKYRYTVHKKTLFFKDLPKAFDGFTITQISDIHSGSFDDKRAVQKGIDMINEQGSDLFVFTGDLVNQDASEFEPYKEMFSQIKAPYGQYSTLGNHDYGEYGSWPSQQHHIDNNAKVRQHHADIGFKLMQNEAVELEKNGEKISLVGIENWGEGFSKYGDLDKALQKAPKDAFKVLLSHDPTHFDSQVKNHETPIHLTLSGHTHGMQMGVDLSWLRWSPSQFRYRRWADLYQENERYLYVNRGFGFIGFSGRVGIWPEITVLELRTA